MCGELTYYYSITCALCKRDLPLRRFSTTALRRLRSLIHHDGMGILSNQQVARCDGCGTQSRPELHCMACNTTRPIDEFAHTQRQYDQPVSWSFGLGYVDVSLLMSLNRFAFYARTVCRKMSGTGFSPDIFHAVSRPLLSRCKSMKMSALSLRCLLYCARWLIMSYSSRTPSQLSLLPRLPNRPSVQGSLPRRRTIQLGQFSVV